MGSDGLKIGVIGAGAWGTALARLLARSGNSVQLWCHEAETRKDILTETRQHLFFTGYSTSGNTWSQRLIWLEIVRNSRILVAAPTFTLHPRNC